MAEKVLLKARVAGIDFADPITSEEGVATASWKEQAVTLRDDEVSITEGDPTESEVYSHENDAPEDYDLQGSGLSAVGSFIKCTRAQLVELMGGKVSGEGDAERFYHSAKKLMLEKAIRFRLKNGGELIIPYAKGSVQLNSNNGADGLIKYPFRFRALAQTDFDCDLIM